VVGSVSTIHVYAIRKRLLLYYTNAMSVCFGGNVKRMQEVPRALLQVSR
jgi:hypothetical protein